MKKIVTITSLFILGLLFWAPWMGEDGGEKIIQDVSLRPEVRAELENIKGCEGLSSSWAPFGRRVEYCEGKSWYVGFWNPIF